MSKTGFLLLCGGHSSRMGQSKALLDIGGRPLVMHIADAGQGFSERILSVNDDAIPTPDGFVRVSDLYTDCGPMGGLQAALSLAQSEALVVAPCDAPNYSAQLAQYLASRYTPELDAIILFGADGKAHPLMGVYSKRCLPALEANLREGRFKLMRMLSQLRTLELTLPPEIPQSVFDNLNTPEDLARILKA